MGTRETPPVPAAALAAAALLLAGAAALRAHGDEARYVRDLGWATDQISRAVAVRHALGLRGEAPAHRVVTIGGQRCVEADLVGFDVADAFAFDIDEPVELEVLFAAPAEVAFTVAYDRNRGRGILARLRAVREPEGDWSRASVVLDRARFADRGEHATDFAIAAFYREGGSPGQGGRPGPRRPAAICQIRLSRSRVARQPPGFGELELTLADPQTGATAARVGLYDQTGRTPLPSGSSVLLRWFVEARRQLTLRRGVFWPEVNRRVFYVDGTYRARIPAGEYLLVAMKGPEYRLVRERFEIAAGSTRRIARTFERWIDMPGRGWYSGDTHLHARRRDRVDDESLAALIDAEDLWVASTLQMGNITRTYFDQRWGQQGRFERRGRHLVAGQEDPRTERRGHTLSLNLRRPVRNPQRYFLFHEVAERVRRQGGLWGYAHGHRGWFNPFRGLAVDLPFGVVDFLEILQGSRRGASLGGSTWYRYLNLGLKLAPTAGTDYPYVDLPGEVRSYVQVDGELTVDGWYEGLRAGRTFVTNGPMLRLDVAGHGMGEELRVATGAAVRVRARADLNPDLGRLSKLMLIVHGEVVDLAESSEGATSLELDHTLTVGQSLWLAVRAEGEKGKGAALAHSAPVYLIVDGAPFWNRTEVPRIVAWQLEELQRLRDGTPRTEWIPETWESAEAAAREWSRQRPLLESRIAEARARYLELRRRAEWLEQAAP